MTDYHEPPDDLAQEDRDLHRALTSLKEEIEAVDWYHQRVVSTQDASLRSVLAHNRDEEIEHASMTLEWLRRNVEAWNEKLSRHLFSEGPIRDVPGEGEQEAGVERVESTSLGIGSLRERFRFADGSGRKDREVSS
jgi:ferritin-like protein